MADIFGIILNSFNLFTPIWMAFGVLLGVFIYMFISQPKKNIVWKVNPNSQYGYDFNIQDETPFGIRCKGFKNQPPQRFFKYMPSMLTYYQDWKGRAQTLVRWMGIEGTAYTQKLSDVIVSQEVKRLNSEGVLETVPEKHVVMPSTYTLAETLKILWDEKFWNTVPPERRKAVEEAKLGITVALTQKELPDWKAPAKNPDGTISEVPSKLVSLTEDNTMSELDKEAATMKYKGMKAAGKGTTLNYLLAVGAGVGLGLGLALLLGWIQLAPKAPVTSPTAPVTTKLIWWLMSHV